MLDMFVNQKQLADYQLPLASQYPQFHHPPSARGLNRIARCQDGCNYLICGAPAVEKAGKSDP